MSGTSQQPKSALSTTPCSLEVPAKTKAGDIHPIPRMSLPGIVGIEAVEEGVRRAWNKKVELLEAKETKFFAFQGKVVETEEVEAQGIQLKAAQAIHEVSGAVPGRPREDDRSRREPQTINLTVLFGISPPGEVVEAVTVDGEVEGET